MKSFNATEVVTAAKKVFSDGIYVESNKHPCGWDYICFEHCDIEDAEYFEVDCEMINDFVYETHELDGKTIKWVINNKKWAFELSQLDI